MDPCGCLQHLVDGFTSATVTIESTTSAGAQYNTVLTFQNNLVTPTPPAPPAAGAVKPAK